MTKTHIRRTPEQIIAELEARIAAVKARAAAKTARTAPESAPFLIAARAVRKAQETARAARNARMDAALESALATMSACAVEAGLRMPQGRTKPAGGRRKKTPAA